MTYSCSLYNSLLNIKAFAPWLPICDWWARVSGLVAYSWIPVRPCFSCSSHARAVLDGLGSVNLSRNFPLRSLYFVNVVYFLLSIYVAAHSTADPLKREIMYLICCLSEALLRRLSCCQPVARISLLLYFLHRMSLDGLP